MNENEYIARIARQQLEQDLPIVLVSIMNLQGSSPRHYGSKMLVGKDGKCHGTIGGSLIEAEAIRESREIIFTKKSKILQFELSGEDAAAPGMICGGKAELLLDYFPATEENKIFAKAWHEAVSSGRDIYFLTSLADTDISLEISGHAILFSNGSTAGNSGIADAEIETLRSELHNLSTTTIVALDNSRILIDRIRKIKTLFCFGAGHVAVPTAHLAKLVGFRVIVMDDRAEYANVSRFPDADDVRVIKDFNHPVNGQEIDADSYIIILTRGHQYDREVLEEALKTSAGYIGMISSRRKKQAIFEALISAGVRKEALDKVYSPIGLDIGGETPEEIAVSIVAELISVRSKQQS